MSEAGFGLEAASLAAIRALCAQTPGLDRLWIFGSRARGDHRQRSDIDLVADAPGWTLRDSLDFVEALKHLPMVYPVDCAWWQDKGLETAFRGQVEHDRRLLWEPRRVATAAEAPGSISLKRFQSEALDAVARYIDEIKRHAAQAAVAQRQWLAMENMQDEAREVGDFPKKAWKALARVASSIPSPVSWTLSSTESSGAR